jgi:hypothetical protein
MFGVRPDRQDVSTLKQTNYGKPTTINNTPFRVHRFTYFTLANRVSLAKTGGFATTDQFKDDIAELTQNTGRDDGTCWL